MKQRTCRTCRWYSPAHLYADPVVGDVEIEHYCWLRCVFLTPDKVEKGCPLHEPRGGEGK